MSETCSLPDATGGHRSMTRLEFHHKEAIHEKVRHLNGKQVSSGFLLREGTIPSVVPGKRPVSIGWTLSAM